MILVMVSRKMCTRNQLGPSGGELRKWLEEREDRGFMHLTFWISLDTMLPPFRASVFYNILFLRLDQLMVISFSD